jgi:hypothetical protein
MDDEVGEREKSIKAQIPVCEFFSIVHGNSLGTKSMFIFTLNPCQNLTYCLRRSDPVRHAMAGNLKAIRSKGMR